MIEIRRLIVHDGHGIQPNVEKLQYRQKKIYRNHESINLIRDEWSDWIDVPTVKET